MLPQCTESGQQRILLLEHEQGEGIGVAAKLAEAFPQTVVLETHSLDGYLQALGQGDFDIVVLNYDLPDARGSELLAQLRVRDHEPDVLIVSRCEEPETIRRIAESRKRYVVRDEKWIDSLVLALRDMIRIRRLEQEMSLIKEHLTIANAKLEEKNRRLDDFCATIAHDIRGPLAGLILKTEYIVDTYRESLDERCLKLLTRSAESAHRLIGVVQGMYEYAKVGAGVVRFERVDLANLVSDVLGDLNIEDSIEVKIGVGQLPVVWGNTSQLRRIFVNLIANSIKYNDKDEVRIIIGSCSDTGDESAGYARLYVEDNGPGIAREEIATIFDMFRRGRSHKDDTEGMGIGLAVVQRIIELHQGSIELTSELGCGCRFTFSLPTSAVQGILDVAAQSESDPPIKTVSNPAGCEAHDPIRHSKVQVL